MIWLYNKYNFIINITWKLIVQKIDKTYSLSLFLREQSLIISHKLQLFSNRIFRGERVNYHLRLLRFLFFFLSIVSEPPVFKSEGRFLASCDKLERLRFTSSSKYNESGKPVPEGCCVNGNARGCFCFIRSLFRDARERHANTMLPKMNWERREDTRNYFWEY